jgi:lysophospholipase L1-like esterase
VNSAFSFFKIQRARPKTDHLSQANLSGRRARTAAVVLFALVTLSISPAVVADHERDRDHGRDRHWIASWGASPSDPAPQLADQTVREHVRLSYGGDSIRLRLSNRFGTQSLLVGAVHVALQDSGPAVVAGTDTEVTFHGSPSVTIPPGAQIVSDPVALSVARLQELAVSLYLPGDTGPLTIHSLGVQTAYISAPGSGDLTASTVLPVSATSLSRYLLSDVEVESRPNTDAVVTLGDSITDGYCSTVDANHRWPDFLADRLNAGRGFAVTVVDQGISGNRLLHNVAGPNGLERFDRDVIAQTGVRWVTVLLGINDIGFMGLPFQPPGESPVTAEDIIAAHHQLIVRAHEAGLKIYGGTLTPFEGTTFSGYYTPEKELIRLAVNKWIRTSGEYDAVIDFDKAVRDPHHPGQLLPTYDCGDHLHPNDAGYQAMADAVKLHLFNGN